MYYINILHNIYIVRPKTKKNMVTYQWARRRNIYYAVVICLSIIINDKIASVILKLGWLISRFIIDITKILKQNLQ